MRTDGAVPEALYASRTNTENPAERPLPVSRGYLERVSRNETLAKNAAVQNSIAQEAAIACDKREAFAQGREATKQSILP